MIDGQSCANRFLCASKHKLSANRILKASRSVHQYIIFFKISRDLPNILVRSVSLTHSSIADALGLVLLRRSFSRFSRYIFKAFPNSIGTSTICTFIRFQYWLSPSRNQSLTSNEGNCFPPKRVSDCVNFPWRHTYPLGGLPDI
jgi:hypothetical protein